MALLQVRTQWQNMPVSSYFPLLTSAQKYKVVKSVHPLEDQVYVLDVSYLHAAAPCRTNTTTALTVFAFHKVSIRAKLSFSNDGDHITACFRNMRPRKEELSTMNVRNHENRRRCDLTVCWVWIFSCMRSRIRRTCICILTSELLKIILLRGAYPKRTAPLLSNRSYYYRDSREQQDQAIMHHNADSRRRWMVFLASVGPLHRCRCGVAQLYTRSSKVVPD